jgi:hypothetical protein
MHGPMNVKIVNVFKITRVTELWAPSLRGMCRVTFLGTEDKSACSDGVEKGYHMSGDTGSDV